MGPEEVIRAVKSLTVHGDGTDVTVDAAGFASTCENAVHCARPAGRMVQVGLPIGEQRPQVPMGLVASKELELVGSHGFAADDLPELLQLVASGVLDPSQLVERQVSLQEGAQAIQDMDHGSPLGMTVVTQFRSEKSRL
jgi:alcohol dehydrogenase